MEIVTIKGCRSWRFDAPARKVPDPPLESILIVHPNDNDAVEEEALVVKNSFHGMSLRWMVIS